MNYQQAFDYVKSRRKVTHPNENFKCQLQLYEKELKKIPSNDYFLTSRNNISQKFEINNNTYDYNKQNISYYY